jgi:hypothetical protein
MFEVFSNQAHCKGQVPENEISPIEPVVQSFQRTGSIVCSEKQATLRCVGFFGMFVENLSFIRT